MRRLDSERLGRMRAHGRDRLPDNGYGRCAGRFPPDSRLPAIYRLLDDSSELVPSDPQARDPKLARLEAALMLADEPLAARKLAAIADLADTAEARHLLDKLKNLYDAEGTAFQIEEIAGGFQLLTRPVYHPWLLRLRRSSNELRLSSAALETLAIVAYRQPIMRADVDNIRGVQCSELLHQLVEKGLVKITGHHDSLGRPVLYGTTKKFLQVFGLNSLKDLPEVEQLRPPK
jgi:segregation and condensation protein B